MSSIKGTCVMSTSSDGSRISLTCTRTDLDASGNADVSGNVDVSGNIASTQLMPQSIAECAFAPGPNTGQVMMTCNHVAAWTDPSGSVMDVSGSVVDVSGSVVDVSGSVMDVSGSVVDVSGSVMDVSGSVMDVSGSVMDVSGELLSFGNLTYTTYMTQTNNEYSYM